MMTAMPDMQSKAYRPIPNPWATAAISPFLRPPLRVCCSTTAREGPGDIAPNKQIETTVSHIVIVMALKSDVLAFWMHPHKIDRLISVNLRLSRICHTIAPQRLVAKSTQLLNMRLLSEGCLKFLLETTYFAANGRRLIFKWLILLELEFTVRNIKIF